MANLLVRFIIITKDHENSLYPNGPLFHRFLPDGKQDSISKKEEHYKIKFWFEQRGFQAEGSFIRYDPNRKDINKSDIPKQAILDGGYLFGEIEFFNIDENKIDDLNNNKITESNYKQIGKKIVKTIYNEVIDFLSIFKNIYGQYWIQFPEKWDYRSHSLGSYCRDILNASFYNSVSKSWEDFIPNEPIQHLVANIDTEKDYSIYITKTDWDKIKDIYRENFEEPKAIKYMQSAHASYDSGDYSNAFIEAVTSLESTIDAFYNKRMEGSDIIQEQLKSLKGLPYQKQFSSICIINQLCDSDELKSALNAIDIRNKIVHEGLVVNSKKYTNDFYNLLNILLRMLEKSNIVFPERNPGNVFRKDWGEK